MDSAFSAREGHDHIVHNNNRSFFEIFSPQRALDPVSTVFVLVVNIPLSVFINSEWLFLFSDRLSVPIYKFLVTILYMCFSKVGSITDN